MPVVDGDDEAAVPLARIEGSHRHIRAQARHRNLHGFGPFSKNARRRRRGGRAGERRQASNVQPHFQSSCTPPVGARFSASISKRASSSSMVKISVAAESWVVVFIECTPSLSR